MCVLTALTLLTMLSRIGDDSTPILALDGLDPVALAGGKELPGSAGRVVDLGKYRYQFATDESREIFQKAPDAHKIQMAGSCARMGLLTGYGDPSRWLVHDRKIYIFASDQCRESFAKDPARFLDAAATEPTGSQAESEAAAKLLDKAISAHGGAERLKSLKTLRRDTTLTYGSGATATTGKQTTTMRYPNAIRLDDDWGTSKYGDATDGRTGVRYGRETHAMEDIERDCLQQRIAHDPMMLLKAAAEDDANLRTFARGSEGEGDVKRSLIEFWWQGAATLLVIDDATGRVVESRVVDHKIGRDIETRSRFSDFKAVDGLLLPFAVESVVNGIVVSDPMTSIKDYAVDFDVRDEMFTKP